MTMDIEPISPIRYSAAVTPSDSTDLANPCRALLVGTSGDVKVTYTSGVTDTLYLEAGIWHGMLVCRIWSTGTTATAIHAGF
jgi:hypothetical protein